VTEVDAVERSDRHHRAFGGRRAFARVVRDLHGPTIPAQAVNAGKASS
jgi:hypothetical protein